MTSLHDFPFFFELENQRNTLSSEPVSLNMEFPNRVLLSYVRISVRVANKQIKIRLW